MKMLVVALTKLYQKFPPTYKSLVCFLTGSISLFTLYFSGNVIEMINNYGVVRGSRPSLSQTNRHHPWREAGLSPVRLWTY